MYYFFVQQTFSKKGGKSTRHTLLDMECCSTSTFRRARAPVKNMAHGNNTPASEYDTTTATIIKPKCTNQPWSRRRIKTTATHAVVFAKKKEKRKSTARGDCNFR